jgi:hypothetical protein
MLATIECGLRQVRKTMETHPLDAMNDDERISLIAQR